MTAGVRHSRLPQGEWISLCSALAWLTVENAYELPDLLEWAEREGVTDDELRSRLTERWQVLANFRHKGQFRVRARRNGAPTEILLAEDEFRNCRFIGWRKSPAPTLELLRHPFTFADAFHSRSAGLPEGYDYPVVNRLEVVKFREWWERERRSTITPDYDAARAWLNAKLAAEDRVVGHKAKYMRALTTQFGLSKNQAGLLWTQLASKHDIPLHGRPRKTQRTNSDRK